MKTKTKSFRWEKLWMFFLVLVLCSTVRAKADGGYTFKCGDNVTAKLQGSVLTISGSGDMWDRALSDYADEEYIDDCGSGITSIVIADGVTSIGNYAFNGWTDLTKVSIGASVKSIGGGAFEDTKELSSISIPGNVQTIGAYAFDSSGLTECQLQFGLKYIEKGAFQHSSLRSIVIPDGVSTIGASAFQSAGLSNVTLPLHIDAIGADAFKDNSASVTIYSDSVTISSGAFDVTCTFSVYQNSTADTYAKSKGISCKYFECTPDDDLPALYHSLNSGKVTKKATCTDTGEKTYTCTACGETRTEIIYKTSHKWEKKATVDKKATCTANGRKSIHCKNCSEVKNTTTIKAAGHTYGEWKVTVKATVLKKGTQTRKCSVCGHKQTKKIPKLTPVIELNVTNLPLKAGQTAKVIKVTKKANGDSIASWTSTNDKIVKVDSKGKIKGLKAGTAYVKVTLKSGISARVKVTVQTDAVSASKMSLKIIGTTLKNNKMTLEKGKTYSLVTTLTPLTTTDTVSYTSSSPKAVTVSKDGTLTAKAKGTAVITITAGNMKMQLKATVK